MLNGNLLQAGLVAPNFRLDMTIQNTIEKLKMLLTDRFGTDDNPWISNEIADDAYIGTSPSGYSSYKGKFDDHLWEDREPGVEGLSNLRNNLENTGAESIFSYSMLDSENGRRYEVYTDPDINELVGVLRFPVPDDGEPYPVRLKKLKDILARSYGSVENPWLSKDEIERVKIRIATGRGGDLSGFQSTYERRGRLNRDRGDGIEGYDCLLQNMATTDAKDGDIHWVIDASKREYAIFTNSEITELFGILRFPEDWENKKKNLPPLKASTE